MRAPVQRRCLVYQTGCMTQVPAAERTIAILRHLAQRHRPVPAASVARALGLPRSTTYHLLAALERGGLVAAYPAQRTWGLGIASFELGQAYLRQIPLERIARPIVRALALEAGETAHLAVLHGNEVLYLVKEDAVSATPLVTDVGVRLPAHLTATGRAMLAVMSEAQVRALFAPRRPLVDRTGRGPRDVRSLLATLESERVQGWSVERGHVSDDIASGAVALRPRAPAAAPIAAVGVSVWEPKLNGPAVPSLVGAVRRAVAALEAALNSS